MWKYTIYYSFNINSFILKIIRNDAAFGEMANVIHGCFLSVRDVAFRNYVVINHHIRLPLEATSDSLSVLDRDEHHIFRGPTTIKNHDTLSKWKFFYWHNLLIGSFCNAMEQSQSAHIYCRSRCFGRGSSVSCTNSFWKKQFKFSLLFWPEIFSHNVLMLLFVLQKKCEKVEIFKKSNLIRYVCPFLRLRFDE